MDEQVKLKKRLPRGAIKAIAKLVGVSGAVVGSVINNKVEVRRGGRIVRICSEAFEAKIKITACSIIEQHESMLSKASKQVQDLTSTHPLNHT